MPDPYKSLIYILFLILCAPSVRAEYKLGGFLGFGGAGIKKGVTIGSDTVDVERGDGPGIMGIAVETLISDTTSLSIDHTRGVYFSPFSNGVSFTGVTWRWYFWGKALAVAQPKEDISYLLISKFIPFMGAATGLASGVISRENDLVSSVNASGLYVGAHGGFDYQTVPGKFMRFEALYAMTPPSSGLVHSSLSLFSMQMGMYFIY